MATCDDQDPPERKRNMFFMETQRGKEVPVVNDYIFICKDRDRKRFRCRTIGCPASITVFRDENGQYYTGAPLHDHPPHTEIIAKMNRRNALRVRARSKDNLRLSTRQIAVEFGHEHAPARRLSSDLRFIRRNCLCGAVPKTYKDIVIDAVAAESIVFKTDDNGIIVFGTDELIVAASATKLLCVDGTFSRCPKTHYQLLTCHAVCHDGFSFLFAFALLPDKKSASYQSVFDEIDNKSTTLCGRAVFSRDDAVVSCDFERGILKALDTTCCSVRCCHFHMNQAIWRFVRRKGMARRYVTDAEFRSRVRSLMVLPLFPQDKIVGVFESIKEMLPRDDNDILRVFNYFAGVWIRSIPMSCWCQYGASFRTNNIAESFHAALTRTIIQHHPEFNAFMHTVNTLLSNASMKLHTQQLNPKSNAARLLRKRATLKAMVDNYFIGPPLALPLKQLLPALFERLHEKEKSEAFFEAPKDETEDYSDVPMETVDDALEGND